MPLHGLTPPGGEPEVPGQHARERASVQAVRELTAVPLAVPKEECPALKEDAPAFIRAEGKGPEAIHRSDRRPAQGLGAVWGAAGPRRVTKPTSPHEGDDSSTEVSPNSNTVSWRQHFPSFSELPRVLETPSSTPPPCLPSGVTLPTGAPSHPRRRNRIF